jgi:hypothetical protein
VNPTGQIIYSLTVPSTPESLTVLEGLCETFITASEKVTPDVALLLRLSVAEACRNALALPPVPGRLNLTTLTFQRMSPGTDAAGICMEVSDSGDGLRIGGCTPPYPSHLHGTEVVLAQPLHQQVVARVADEWRATLSSRELTPLEFVPSREALMAGSPEQGLGLLALCRCWSDVSFHHRTGKGTTVRLVNANLSP